MGLRASEWIAVAYFLYLAGAAAMLPHVVQQRRWRVILTAIAVIIAVVAASRLGNGAMWWRDWLPLIYLVIAYWLPSLLVTGTSQVLERRLLALDERWQITTIGERAPRPLIKLLELAYLCCYPMVPLGFALLYFGGWPSESDRFWTAVLVAVFACYGMLPWLPTRPPRAIESAPPRSSELVRSVNLRVLGLVSNQLNTFPSGHVAASLATALAVSAGMPRAGFLLGVLALAIAAGSVVGRYHYAADALTGAAVALLGFVISRFV